MCIKVAKYPAAKNPNLVTDCGDIQTGNVQIHLDADNKMVTELVATS